MFAGVLNLAVKHYRQALVEAEVGMKAASDPQASCDANRSIHLSDVNDYHLDLTGPFSGTGGSIQSDVNLPLDGFDALSKERER